jgi:hypothetical protein
VAGRAITVVQQGLSSSAPFGGIFNGLFTNLPPHTNSGYLTLKVSASGAFSGTVRLVDGRWSFRGQFDVSRQAALVIPRLARPTLSLQLLLESCAAQELRGSIYDGNSTAGLLAYRNPFHTVTNPCPYAGKYTFAIPGGSIGEKSLGHGYGTLTIASNGTTKVAGALGDGTKVKMAGWLAQNASYPIYNSIYRRGGSLYGWITTAHHPINGTPNGDLAWTKSANALQRFYPDGFTNSVAVIGSRYQPPLSSAAYVLPYTNALVYFSGGNLPGDLERTAALLPGNVFSVAPPTDGVSGTMSLRLKVSQGLITGSINLPQLRRSFSYRGAFLQDFGIGYGLINGTNQIGQLILAPAVN